MAKDMAKGSEAMASVVHEASSLVEKHNTLALKQEDFDAGIAKIEGLLKGIPEASKATAEPPPAPPKDNDDGDKFGKKR